MSLLGMMAVVEPLGEVSVHLLSSKKALLQVLTSVKRVSDFCVLSVSLQCLMLSADRTILHPNPALMLKVNTSHLGQEWLL